VTLAVAGLAVGGLLVPTAAHGSAGDLDPAFGSDGIVVTDFGGADDTQAYSVALDGHGRIAVLGFDGTSPALARYVPGGNPDATFGTDGLVRDDGLSGAALAVDSANRSLVGGDVLARYKANGDPDPVFGTGGTAALPGMTCVAIAIDSVGRIIVGGPASGGGFKVARYLANGTPDSSFGTGGTTTTGFAGSAMTLDPAGRIVVAGGDSSGVKVARYRPGGVLDPTFDDDGIATGATNQSAAAVAIDPRGRVIVAGTAYPATTRPRFALSAFKPNGAVAGSFGDAGTATTDVGGHGMWNYGEDAAIDSQGRIVVGGYAHGNDRANFALVRYNPDGGLDRSFSGDGISLTAVSGAAHPHVNSLAIDSQGRIVAVGGANQTHTSAVYEWILGRYVGVAPPVVSITSGPTRSSPTNDPTPTFGFAADEFGSTYECRADGSAFIPCTSPHPTRRLADGVHTFAVRATDLDGLTGATRSREFRVDTVAPGVEISGPSKVRTHRRRTRVRFTFTATESARFQCKVDSKRPRRCSSPYRTPRLGTGRHRLRVVATDDAGNVGSDAKRFRIVPRR
jgi:uncharacterized delta-60 repeat protein